MSDKKGANKGKKEEESESEEEEKKIELVDDSKLDEEDSGLLEALGEATTPNQFLLMIREAEAEEGIIKPIGADLYEKFKPLLSTIVKVFKKRKYNTTAILYKVLMNTKDKEGKPLIWEQEMEEKKRISKEDKKAGKKGEKVMVTNRVTKDSDGEISKINDTTFRNFLNRLVELKVLDTYVPPYTKKTTRTRKIKKKDGSIKEIIVPRYVIYFRMDDHELFKGK